MKRKNNFIHDQSGAVTVDWVILGAAIVGIGMASVISVRTGTNDLGADTQAALSGVEVASLGELGGLGGGWEFTGLFTTREWIEGPGGLVEQISNWNHTNAQLQNNYDNYARAAQRYLDQGNTRIAGLMVDHMYAVEQVMANQGGTVSSASVSVQSMHGTVAAA
ncbi:hypothetical protein ROE7235_00605 [Roseibaca ekhonensis]|jgi:hypothetical protein|uniref:Uncharacterized protein n=1 Tax=Roseinatronobacter ekhonensis TaxID=254356 RepID=A0A3B0MSD7_9RHOB|nr:hypothetical protein [Roseibaca ekhonensis]SUZ30876.1 hypothetical protein ROE7235_00605 [Roseibaca ekhonensis]